MFTNTQKILDEFVGNIKYESLHEVKKLEVNEILYHIETNEGDYYIFCIDYISSFYYVVKQIIKILDFGYKFVKVKSPIDKFENCPQSKFYFTDKSPEGFNELKEYMNWKSDQDGINFYFLVKKTSSKDEIENGASFLNNIRSEYYSNIKTAL